MTDGVFLFIGAIFVTVFLLSQVMIVPVFGEGRQSRKKMKKRLAEIEKDLGQASFSSLLREKYLRELNPLERALESLPLMENVTTLLEQAGRNTLAHRFVMLSIGLGVASSITAWVFTHHILATLIVAAVAGALPFMKVVGDRNRRIQKFEEQLPDAVDMIKRALRAGHPFSGAIKLVGEETQQPLAKEFQTTFADLNYGNDVRRAMLGLLQRVPSVPVMALVTSVLVQKETGGNLAEILGQISGVIRSRFRLERKIKTLSAEGRMSTWVLAMVPLVLFGVIWITTPDYLPTLMEDPFGRKLVVYGFISAAVGAFWVRRIIRIDV
jgi:tight adherence protein B